MDCGWWRVITADLSLFNSWHICFRCSTVTGHSMLNSNGGCWATGLTEWAPFLMPNPHLWGPAFSNNCCFGVDWTFD